MFDTTEIIKFFEPLFCDESRGFEAFITRKTDTCILERLALIENKPLTLVQLNQLFSFAKIAAISDGFFCYYWITNNIQHTYDINKLLKSQSRNWVGNSISTFSHLKWGLERICIDCLLYFGNINAGFLNLHDKSFEELNLFFGSKRYDTDSIASRGEPLGFSLIDKEDRYLISEMACKTYDKQEPKELVDYLEQSFLEAQKRGVIRPKIRHLLEGKYVETAINQMQLELSTTDILDTDIENIGDIKDRCYAIAARFNNARQAAMRNTRLFLSLVHDLDVYVATSMRTKNDFIQMANICNSIFADNKVKELNIRYFDPTISAAESHEDKGLIECLMVKCCKVLIYYAGEKESYGKDAEAAMALSLGKPVIFLCDNVHKKEFYQNSHPLTRLIDFNTGVANGAMIAKDTSEVSDLLFKIFTNDMRYEINQKRNGYYLLFDKTTKSVVRLQTNDKFLSNSFWNYYRDH